MANSDAITIQVQGSEYLVSGSYEKISHNRMAMMYLRRNLPNFTIQDDGIHICSSLNISLFMEHINALAAYAKCSVLFGEQVDNSMREYKHQENLFVQFSSSARNIRDNKPNLEEFNAFKESLINNMRNRQLYPLQLLSAFHLAFAQNACNFSVPGAGKTSVVYGAYAYLKNLPPTNPKHVDHILIIGPLSSFGPWENEYQECFGYKCESKRLIGGLSSSHKSEYLHSYNPAELTLTSYQSVMSIKDDLKFFLRHHNVMVVLDEAHKIKNTTGAITANSTMELAEFAKARAVLTGTPAPNGYEDLYNLFKFIWPDRDIISFNVGQLSNMSQCDDEERVSRLIEQISPFFIRVRKSDLNIPPAHFQVVRVAMSETQRNIYDAIERRTMEALSTEHDESPFLSRIRKAKLIRLMQVATNPALLRARLFDIDNSEDTLLEESEDDQAFIAQLAQYITDETPVKFVKTAELVENIITNGGKVVIWATFIQNIEGIKTYLNSRGIATRELYGATPVEKDGMDDEQLSLTREAIVREFNSDNSSFNVIIANPFAVAESISLHKKCHNAIYIERSFNAAHFIQSKDRIHRYGLPPGTNTQYYYLVSENSVDETINDRLALKEERLNTIMETMPIPLFDNVLSAGGRDDIKAILSDYAKRAKKI